MTEHWLPREVLEFPSQELLKSWLDMVLATSFRWHCLSRSGWARWPPEIPSNLNHDMILWYKGIRLPKLILSVWLAWPHVSSRLYDGESSEKTHFLHTLYSQTIRAPCTDSQDHRTRPHSLEFCLSDSQTSSTLYEKPYLLKKRRKVRGEKKKEGGGSTTPIHT